MMLIRETVQPRALGLWNAFGALDLLVAVSLGVLSAPATRIQIFTGPPGTAAMSNPPWVLWSARDGRSMALAT
jgi:hypothetical protein